MLHLKNSLSFASVCAWCDADDALKAWRDTNPTSYIGQSEEAKKLLKQLIDSYGAFLKTHPFIKDHNHKEYLLTLFNELPPEPPKPRKKIPMFQKPFTDKGLLICKIYAFMVELHLHMSNVNVEVKKNASENALSLIRRFQKRVQESGVLPRVRGIRYNDRPLSALKTKRAKLKKLANLAKYEEDKKMGKVIERKKGRR